MYPNYSKQAIERRAEDVTDAFNQGWFEKSITRDEFLDAVTTHNPSLDIRSSSTHRGLFDRVKCTFVCGIGENFIMSPYTIYDKDNMVIARSYHRLFQRIEKAGYKLAYEKIPY